MILPETIKAAATVGTAQMPTVSFEGVNPALLAIIQQADHLSPEGQIMTAAIGLQLQHLAGQIPPVMKKQTLSACEPDDRQPCGARALRQLMLMLEGFYPTLLPEWLREVARNGRRAPEEALPLLLEQGRKRKELRPLILPVLGERGRWLGRQVTTHKWNWFELQNVDRRWAKGADETRVEIIELLRQQNPDDARQRVEQTWQQESDTLRLQFLEAFKHGLSANDEPFLESVRDDSSTKVREQIEKLLAHLPDSRYCQDMLQQADTALELKQVDGKHIIRIRFELDPTIDVSTLDPISKSLYYGDIPNPRLKLLMSHVPVRYWCEKWQISFDELLAAIPPLSLSMFGEAFVWSVSRFGTQEVALKLYEALFEILQQPEQDLLLTLLPDSFIETQAIEWLQQQAYHAQDVVTRLQRPLSFMEAQTIKRLQQQTYHAQYGVTLLLLAMDDTWSLALGQAWLDSVERFLIQDEVRPDPDTRRMLYKFAHYLPVQLKDDFISILNRHVNTQNVWENKVDEIRLLLNFRYEMVNAIQKGN